jgi:hypothetical protein
MTNFSFEKDARKRHGDFVYRQTWLAATTNEKWRWIIVAIWTIVALLLPLFLYSSCIVVLGWFFEAVLLQKQSSVIEFWWLILAFVMLSWLYVELTSRSSFVNTASTFYSIAADMARMRSIRITIRLAYIATGSVAVICTLMSWGMQKFRKIPFDCTELDVLGSIFSKIGFRWSWDVAEDIYEKIEDFHLGCNSKSKEERIKIIASFALAAKWTLPNPGLTTLGRSMRLTMIRGIILNYKEDFSPEILARLYEAVGDTEHMNQEREKTAAKFVPRSA